MYAASTTVIYVDGEGAGGSHYRFAFAAGALSHDNLVEVSHDRLPRFNAICHVYILRTEINH